MIHSAEFLRLLARAGVEHTDGMIALIPRDPEQWVVPGGEPPEELHVTVQYLSEEYLPSIDPTQLMSVLDEVAGQAGGPIEARIMGHATFNPDGGPDGEMDSCAVYLVSDSHQIDELVGHVKRAYPVPEAHAPYLCHMTAGYGLVAAQLSATGPIVFDRLRLAIGTEVTDFPLM